MTVAVADTPEHVTTTVLVNVPGTVPAVNRPPCVIVPPPAANDHTALAVGEDVALTVRYYHCELLRAACRQSRRVGAIETVATVPGPLNRHVARGRVQSCKRDGHDTPAMRAREAIARTRAVFHETLHRTPPDLMHVNAILFRDTARQGEMPLTLAHAIHLRHRLNR